jgi:hypothetical protein
MNTQLPQIKLKDINIRRFLFVRRFLILSVVMMITAVSIVLFALFPQVQQIIQTTGIIRTEDVTLRNLQRKIAGLAQVNDLEEYANRDKVDQALPVQKPLLPLLETARRVSLSSGASLISIETSPGKLASISAQLSAQPATAVGPDGAPVQPSTITTYDMSASDGQVHGVDKMDIQVTIRGTLTQISDFITQIERSTPITNVTEIDLKDESGEAAANPQFTAELRLSSYYFTRAIEVAIDAPLPETGVKEREFLNQLNAYTVSNDQGQSSQVQGGGRNDLFGVGQ